MAHFADDNHALACGMVLGSLLKAGLEVQPVLDDKGNYTNKMRVKDGYVVTVDPKEMN